MMDNNIITPEDILVPETEVVEVATEAVKDGIGLGGGILLGGAALGIGALIAGGTVLITDLVKVRNGKKPMLFFKKKYHDLNGEEVEVVTEDN